MPSSRSPYHLTHRALHIASYTCDVLHPSGILAALKDKSSSSSSLKIEALTFLRSALESNDPALFQGVLPDLGKAIFAAAQERYYKVGCKGSAQSRLLIVKQRPILQEIQQSVVKC
jgi:hypothetical protein